MSLPQGVWAAALTPLNQNLDPDLDLLAEHALLLVEEGCEGILLFGTTGEVPSFSVAERQTALEGLIARDFAPERLMIGTVCSAMTDTSS